MSKGTMSVVVTVRIGTCSHLHRLRLIEKGGLAHPESLCESDRGYALHMNNMMVEYDT